MRFIDLGLYFNVNFFEGYVTWATYAPDVPMCCLIRCYAKCGEVLSGCPGDILELTLIYVYVKRYLIVLFCHIL